MTISYSKNFVKQAKKLDPEARKKLLERLTIFSNNPLHPLLRNHQLKGKYKEYRSIDVTGDIRALYLQKENEAIFDTLGTRSQLYG
ncbi:MAG TPA: type II toxin-antitoxin system mRNA interferase toxin, RelE/StbE family [Candidatus Saccharimonadales bacterium]|nr:type II toxin-antitoxin system mRNA interferase toxin, RelE/StbE family [Candidatus Saccharimonadales bacterium]